MKLEHGFTPDTKVILPDGRLKEIQHIKVGDSIIGENNKINEVVAVAIENTDTELLSINSSKYFSTPSTKFKTLQGWQNIEQGKTKYLSKFNSLDEIKSIKSKKIKQTLYALSLDGNHSHYANGYLVHNFVHDKIRDKWKKWREKIRNAIKKVVKGIVSGIKKAFSFVTSPFGLKLDAGDYGAGIDVAGSIGGVKFNKESAIVPIPIVYGKRRIGAARSYVQVSGNQEHLYVCYALCEGQVNALTNVILDQNSTSFGSSQTMSDQSQVTSNTGTYKDRATLQFFDGDDNQVASTLLRDNNSNWTNSHRLRGVSYIAAKFTWKASTKDSSIESIKDNPYGGVPNLEADIEGKKIYNVLTLGADSSATNSVEWEDDDQSSWVFNSNPVNVLLDYLRCPRYGAGIRNEQIDYPSFREAAAQCDQTISWGVSNPVSTKAFSFNGVVDTGHPVMTNVKMILATFRGIMPYQNGKYHLKIENGGDDSDITATPSTPDVVFTITQDHLLDGVQVMGEQKTDKTNRVVVTYVDPNNDFEPNQVIFPEPRSFVGDGSTDDLFLRADNEQRIERTITLPHCTSREEALQYAEVFCRRSRNAKVISFQTNLAMAHCTVGDMIKVTDASIGLDGFFRITDLNLDNNNSAVISCDAVEHQSGNYAIATKSEPATVPIIKLPDPTVMAPVKDLTVSSQAKFSIVGPAFFRGRADRMKVSWSAADTPFAVDFVVQFKESAEANFQTFTITDDTEVFIMPVVSGRRYDVRVAARNNFGQRSNFVREDNHRVAGFGGIFRPIKKSHDQDLSG